MEKAAFIASAGITSIWLPPPSDSVSPQVQPPVWSEGQVPHCTHLPTRVEYGASIGDVDQAMHVLGDKGTHAAAGWQLSLTFASALGTLQP